MSTKRQHAQPANPSSKQSSAATTVAWITLVFLALAVVSFYLISVVGFAAPSFQATIVLIFNAGVILMAGLHLRTGSIKQRIFWGAYHTVYRDRSPRWFWISWWAWLMFGICFSEIAFIGYWMEITGQRGVVE